MRYGWAVLVIFSTCLTSTVAWGHGSALGTLKIQQVDESTFGVLWKRNRAAVLAEGSDLTWPDNCRVQGTPQTTYLEAATLERFQIACSGDGLSGGTILLPPKPVGLHALIETKWTDGAVDHQLLRDQREVLIRYGEGASGIEVFGRYWIIGIEHIIFGPDHLLFVLGLLFLVATLRRLAWVVTAFTLAHSLTLGLAVFDIVNLASAPVEACIALSIILLAREALSDADTVTRRAPWLVGFGFGLLHGLGFAGALSEVGLPQDQLPMALLAFNIGVETGQLAFVGVVWGLLRWCANHWPSVELKVRHAICYAMGSLAVMWTIERTVSIWG